MKKKFIITTLIIFTIIVAVVWFVSQGENNISIQETPHDATPEFVSSVSAKDKEKELAPNSLLYCIKEYKGNIAVFEENKEKPFKTTNISVKDLPSEDQKLLKQGIKVENKEELNNLIEDYCS